MDTPEQPTTTVGWAVHHDHETGAVTIRDGDREVARVADISDALAIVNAHADVEEYDAILSRQGDLLTRTVNALRGAPPALTSWSLHDVPELAAAAVAALDDMLGQCEQAQRWVAEGKYDSAQGFNIVLGNANRIRAERAGRLERGES